MKHSKYFFTLFFIFILLQACQPTLTTKQVLGNPEVEGDEGLEESDPPEVKLGERLFRETRFAQFFFAHSNGKVNQPLNSGDPVMDLTATLENPLVGPYQGKSMNCAACHLVDEQQKTFKGGIRTYADFARRSPIPAREDGKTLTPRNSPALVNSTFTSPDELLLHFDGQFASIEELVRGTLTGRNYGWLATEEAEAIAQVANVIRKDDGNGDLAAEHGKLPYQTVLESKDSTVSAEFQIPMEYRLDLSQATDAEILQAVSKLIGAYVNSLIFEQDDQKQFSGSPYDLFLKKNNLPQKPLIGENPFQYSQRLLNLINQLGNPQFVSSGEKTFQFHSQDFVFGQKELEGLKTFFKTPNSLPLSPQTIAQGKLGNCVACHAAPSFSDFKFHNTGAAQEEYDAIHGDGAFVALNIPSLKERLANPEAFLPATGNHPNGKGIFVSIPSKENAQLTDLGLWNVFANLDFPLGQGKLLKILCEQQEDKTKCNQEDLLPLSIAYFKTPGLRDLGHSAPYLHTGQQDTLESVIQHYIRFSNLARDGKVKNHSKELLGIALTANDIESLTAFLKSLNEDYN